MKKVLIIGFDGGTFRIIKKYSALGMLPNFRFLLNNGCHGILKSTIPFLTVPAWPSFYTGVNPGKHGVFHFLTTHKFSLAERKISTCLDLKAKSLWRILSENGKKCLVWNVPMTYPPESINGKLVGGLLSLSTKRYAFPIDFENELRNQNYVIDCKQSDFNDKSKDEQFEMMLNVDKQRHEAWKKYYQKEDFDFSMIVYNSSDILGHNFWDDEHKVIKTYRTLDGFLGDILKMVDKETLLLIMSDHGFTDYKRNLNLTAWLERQGYLFYKKAEKEEYITEWKRMHYKEKKKLLFLKKILDRFGIDRQKVYGSKLICRLMRFVPKPIRKIIRQNISTASNEIDWKKTKAYAELNSKYSWGININLIGRETKGIVKEKEALNLKKEIMMKLEKEIDEDGGKLFEKVLAGSDVYNGDYTSRGTDILVILRDKNKLAVSRFDKKLFTDTSLHTNSYHEADGIFFAFGNGVKSMYEIKNASILDIAPTVLNYLDLQIPQIMDGKTLTDIWSN